ncbi:MAG: hypothetical protein E7493_13345 [Ruminococcus albus]|nr:hypothetical protein [Ruminococcus albus]
MFCRLYIHGSSVKSAAALFEKRFGRAVKIGRDHRFTAFEMTLKENNEHDRNKLRTYPDGFLYYEITAELEIYEDHIRVTDEIPEMLWDNGLPAVVSCEYEEELNRYIFSK